jgi:dipeptidase
LKENKEMCFGIIVGKDASYDGSVLIGHNEQNALNSYINFRKIPRLKHGNGETVNLQNRGRIAQVPETYSFLWSENPRESSGDSYINEYGVTISSDACPGRDNRNDEELEKEGQINDGGLFYMFRRLVIERSKTAREAIDVAGKLIEEKGNFSSRTFIIADPDEAWLLCASRGKQWVAQRVPDDKVVLLPNVFIVGKVDLEDKNNFIASPDIIDYAVKREWYDPDSGKPFRFDEAYSAEREILVDPRQWAGQSIVTKSYIPKTPDRRLPVAVTPAQKMSIADILEVLRFHSNEPEQAEKIRKSGKFSDKGLDMGSICFPVGQETAVFQLRRNLPVEIGCIYWRISAEPCANVSTPWYFGISETPSNYYISNNLKKILTVEHHFSKTDNPLPADDKAWTAFRNLQDKFDSNRNFTQMTGLDKYRNVVDNVLEKWKNEERKLYEEQCFIDKKALELYRKNKAAAVEYLTEYSHAKAERALIMTKELIDKIA